ncbi:MAG: thiamine pyrophosphate-binding protein [Anaerolineaceae bacterium]|nr:thiamine pyrophosphate-binding protein [Anaerolineaceae bacterium]
MNGAQALVQMLIAYETQVVFGLPGDTSVDFYDALGAETSRIRHIMARDERSAGFMADVYARLSGKPGICEGPSGGGASYLLPGVVEAHGSSVAMIALTTDNPLNYEAQGALTDLDQQQIYRAVTKWTALVKSADVLPHFIRRAFRLATSGRPGAVHLSLPKNVQREEIVSPVHMHAEKDCMAWPSHRTRPDPEAVSRAAQKLWNAERPIIVAGGGVVSSGAFDELSAISKLLNAPVTTTINGKGAMAETHPLCLGVIGANGGRPYAAQAVQEADLVLFVGTKANYVNTDTWRLPSLENPPTILQIDVDPAELGNTYPIDVGMCGDARLALTDLRDALEEIRQSPPGRDTWLNGINRDKSAWRAQIERSASSWTGQISSQQVIQELNRSLPEETILVSDPGTTTPFISAGFELSQPGRRIIIPRAQGGLGYAIPGVVGARLARPDLPIVGVFGDGSFAMSAGDLATVARVGGPTILILFNNSCFGWIKTLQNINYAGRYFSVDFPEAINYVDIAKGFGLRAILIHEPDEIGPAVKNALSSGEPSFFEVKIPPQYEEIPPVAPWQKAFAARRDKSIGK